MNHPPIISVIVPVYKAANFLSKCIDSILLQTFTDFELLLVDDGSPDISGKICDDYATKDSRVRVFHPQNGGVSFARNIGLANAIGDHVCFVDSDDWVSPNYLKDLYDGTVPGKLVLVIGGCIRVSDAGHQIAEVKFLHKTFSAKELPAAFACLGAFRGPVSKIFSNQIIKKHELKFDLNLTYGEDTIFFLNYAKFVEYISFKNMANYFYRVTPGSLTHKSNTFEHNYYYYRQIVKHCNELALEHNLSREELLQSCGVGQELFASILKFYKGRINLTRKVRLAKLKTLSSQDLLFLQKFSKTCSPVLTLAKRILAKRFFLAFDLYMCGAFFIRKLLFTNGQAGKVVVSNWIK